MKKKIKILALCSIFIFSFVIMFFPFVNVNVKNEYYCKYRLSVYKCWVCDSEGEGCYSDFFYLNVQLGKKIGGPLEYFGLKEIKKDSIIPSDSLINYLKNEK